MKRLRWRRRNKVFSMEEKVYTGIVTYYSTERHFGFIDSEAGEGIYFYFDTTAFKNMPAKERKEKRKTFRRGDEVNFKLRKGEKGNEAYDLQFIKNERADQLLSLLNEMRCCPVILRK